MIAPQFPPIMGGVATYSYEVARNLARCGEQVTVLTVAPNMDSELINQQGFNLFSVRWLGPMFKLRFFIGKAVRISVLLFYGAWLSKLKKIDLIYCTYYESGIAARFISKLFGIPYFLAIHGTEVTDPKGILGNLVRFSLKGSSGFIVLARRQGINLLKLGVSDNKIHVVPHGVDVRKFSPDSGCHDVASRLALGNKKMILTVGNLVERKGHDMVLKSLPKVLEEVPDAIYLIVGDGEQKQNLKELVDKLDLGEHVIFTGRVPDKELPEYYNACNIFIMPSREIGSDIEGFGIVFLEASACSKPVIGGRSGGVSDAVEDKVSGILVDPLNVDEISKTLITLLIDDELARRLGRQGRKRVEEEFDQLVMANKIAQVFRDFTKK